MHLSDAGRAAVLRAARADGVDVTVETCPHYLTFAAEEIADGDTGSSAAHRSARPPTARRCGRRWRGDIDLVVSDHSPAPPDLKHLDGGDFARRGAASPRSSSACRRCGPVRERAGTRSPTSRAGWPRAGGAVGLADKGRIEAAPTPIWWFDPDEDFTVDVASCTAATRSRRTRAAAAGCRAHLAARRCGGRRCGAEGSDRLQEGKRAMTHYVPRGGLPPQTPFTTDRAMFTEAYAVLPAAR